MKIYSVLIHFPFYSTSGKPKFMEGHLFVCTANRCQFCSNFEKKRRLEVETLVNVLRITYSLATRENIL